MEESNSNIKIIDRVFNILECFLSGGSELSITDLAKRTSLSPSTIHRLCEAIIARGYLERNDYNKKIKVGKSLKQFSFLFPVCDHSNYKECAAKYIAKLMEEFNECVAIYEVSGNQRICVSRSESTHSLRHVVNVGQRLSLSRGAPGKVLLAYMSQEKVTELVGECSEVFMGELASVKSSGYAISIGEREEGIFSLAAPIFGASGQVLGCMSISGPTDRMISKNIMSKIPYFLDITKKISEEVGYPG